MSSAFFFQGPNSPVKREAEGVLYFGSLLGVSFWNWLLRASEVSIEGQLTFDGRDLIIRGAPELKPWSGCRVASIEYRRPEARADCFTRVDSRPSVHIFKRRPRLDMEFGGARFRLCDVRMDLNQLGQPVEMVG